MTVLPISIGVVVLGLAVLSAAAPPQATRATSDDLAFLQPWFNVERNDRDTLAHRGIVVRALPAAQRQLAIIATCAVNAAPEALIAAIAGGATGDGSVSGSFGTPPTLYDLSGLTLDQGDIDRLRQCRPGSCALNLAGDEMSALQRAIDTSGSAVHEAFRRILLDKLRRYQSGGLAALPDYRDRRDPVQPGRVFSDIVDRVPYLKSSVPSVADHLERFPSVVTSAAVSSFGWSKLTINSKPVIMLTHRTTFRLQPQALVPEVLVAGKQVYASRYMNGELSLTMLFGRASRSSSYLVVMSRSDLDELSGTFGGLKRALFESRIKAEAAHALTRLRDRLERVNVR